ncbi:hypothetical protein, partial [Burkholderia pseudomallei]|uniref:hypothetical protein n=3 Tax=Burkholderia pseudomallei TaxID=28450 RepID=UPI001C3C2DFF
MHRENERTQRAQCGASVVHSEKSWREDRAGMAGKTPHPAGRDAAEAGRSARMPQSAVKPVQDRLQLASVFTEHSKYQDGAMVKARRATRQVFYGGPTRRAHPCAR